MVRCALEGRAAREAAGNGILKGAPEMTEAAIVADLTKAASYRGRLAGTTGRLAKPKREESEPEDPPRSSR